MTLTAEELAQLRIPLSTLPEFNPRGLLVHHLHDPSIPGGIVCAWEFTSAWWAHLSHMRRMRLDAIGLDLSESMTADRVARWVAGRVGLEVGCTAPCWGWIPNDRREWQWDAWTIRNMYGHYHGFKQAFAAPLADLDPTDDRRIPDGSRWVDRAALALVAVHVGATP